MKKTVVSAIAGVALFSGAAFAQETTKAFSVDLGVDTYYNVDTEEATAELSAGVTAFNATLAWEPDISIDNVELLGSDITLGYNLKVQGYSVTPYISMGFDGDFNQGDTKIGVKSSFSF